MRKRNSFLNMACRQWMNRAVDYCVEADATRTRLCPREFRSINLRYAEGVNTGLTTLYRPVGQMEFELVARADSVSFHPGCRSSLSFIRCSTRNTQPRLRATGIRKTSALVSRDTCCGSECRRSFYNDMRLVWLERPRTENIGFPRVNWIS